MAARRQVRREATVAAPPDEVWRALVERDLLARWLHEGDGTWARRVVSAAPARRLVFWWWRETGRAPSAGDVSVVEIDLDQARGGTRVTVTETALADHDEVAAGGPGAGAVPLVLGGSRA